MIFQLPKEGCCATFTRITVYSSRVALENKVGQNEQTMTKYLGICKCLSNTSGTGNNVRVISLSDHQGDPKYMMQIYR